MKLNNSSPWLSAKNCKEGETVKFLDEGEWRDSTRFTYDDGNSVRQLIFKVEHNGEEKQLTVIKPSRQVLIEAWGNDTIEWVNKVAEIELALNTQGGKSIILKPLKEEKNLDEPDQAI